MENSILSSPIEMSEWQCCECGVVSFMPKELNENLKRNDRQSFYCVNGHEQWYFEPKKENKKSIFSKFKIFK